MSQTAARLRQARDLMDAGRLSDAAAVLQRGIQADPREPALPNALSLVMLALGNTAQAAFFARRALDLRPGDAAILTNLGNALGADGQAAPAAEAFQQALAREPRLAPAHTGLANVRARQRRFTDAAAYAARALALSPGDPVPLVLYATALLSLGRAEETVRLTAAALRGRPQSALAQLHARALNYLPGVSHEQALAAHRQAAALLAERSPRDPRPFRAARDPNRRLRVGLVSPDLRRHSVAFFLEPWLEHFDRAALEMIAYPTSRADDEVTARFRAHASAWRSPAGEGPHALAERIRADSIDILVDTTGLFEGECLPLLALRPAPLQITMIGYPATTGLPTVDYRLVDSHTDPPGAEAHSTERLVRLDPCFLCYRPPDEAPEPAVQAGAARPITFTSFNIPAKINQSVLALWVRILAEVPDARLVIKSLDLDEPAARDALGARMSAAGLDPARVEILPSAPSTRDHLAVYQRVDIALDTFPYCGTTTTCEALWMGVPVVTLAGDRHASRVGVSLLSAAGLPELIAQDPDDYVRTAVALARDPGRLARLRASLRPRLTASTLTNGVAYAARLDAALRAIWRAYCAHA